MPSRVEVNRGSTHIAADTLVATFNPQLAAWSHSPLAVEIEQHLVRAIGEKFRPQGDSPTGVSDSGQGILASAQRKACSRSAKAFICTILPSRIV